MGNKLIQSQDLSFTYPNGLKALHGLGLDIEGNGGQIIGLLGPNGAGKTTLINILTGLYRNFKGRCLLLGMDVRMASPFLRRRISVTTQQIIVDALLTVEDNLYLFGRLMGLQPAKIRKRMNELLEVFQLNQHKDQLVLNLSGGQMRRVQICRCLLREEAELFFIDEPTLELDPIGKAVAWAKFRELAKNGKSIILASNDMSEVENLCDKIVFINCGRLVFQGTPQKLKKTYSLDEQVRIKIKETISESSIETIQKCLKEIRNIATANGELIFEGSYLRPLIPRICKVCTKEGLEIEEVNVIVPGLPEIFHYIVHKQNG